MTCPLCNYQQSRASWLGSIFYMDREFPYLECLGCRSLFCDPMPDDETLAKMYGPEYQVGFDINPEIEDPKEPSRVVEWLKRIKGQTFVDFGCGSGHLLRQAMHLNWQAIGVEFDRKVAQATGDSTGARVVTDFGEFDGNPVADVLNLGDVIEHLTDINRQLPQILQLIKPGGVLLAQGPLEGNANLFLLAVRAARSINKSRRTEMAPYHVLLATAVGQLMLFDRSRLEMLEYRVHEVAWPAPSRLTASTIRQVRPAGLFILRRMSQAVSSLQPGKWGNRYFYAGRWNG